MYKKMSGLIIWGKRAKKFQRNLEDRYSDLVGGTITSLTFDPSSDEHRNGDFWWGFVVEKKNKKYTVWILKDDEGKHGPGSIEMEVA